MQKANRKKLEKEKAEQAVEQQYIQQAGELGMSSLQGTGYNTFKDLVLAKKRKDKELAADAEQRINNFASLFGGAGRSQTLG